MFRTGFGYDSHRLTPDRPLMLGGVRVENDLGLAGHSDGDVALHAVTDAILGAIGAGDIGEQFPQTDPRWAGADSSLFVKHALTLARQRGYFVNNCDVTILAERPTLQPYKQAMREAIAGLLEVEVAATAVKAKTNEGMGFIGRGEGIAALAVVTLRKT